MSKNNLVPFPKLSKEKILWLYRNRCKHGHRYLTHYNCYLNEKDLQEKIGFLDIEASGLKANFGIMLSYCIKPQGKKKILFDIINAKDMRRGTLDKRIVKKCVEDMSNFHRLVTHYGTRFDVPFLRTRALYWDLDFPEYGEIMHTDIYYYARRLLCLSSNRQGTIAETILHEDIKTRISPKYWIQALQGEKKALDYILDHNKRDVIQLEKNYEKLIKFGRKTNRTL